MKAWQGMASVIGAQLLCVAVAMASADDDYRRGLAAFQRGDVVAAMSTLRPGASAGHAPSQSLLAFILDRADFTEEAATLYRAAAAHGDAEAHAGLANLLLTGRGIAKDEKAAFEHFSKAAQLGHELSIQVVADAYLKNQFGQSAAREPAVAREALERAAGRGHLAAAEALVDACRSGGLGQAADPACEAAWRQRVAEIKRQRIGAPAKGKS